MKKKQNLIKKVVTSFAVVVTMISCFYTISLMNNDNVVKAMEQEREDLLMLTEAYKWIDEEDIDPKTGKLKEGIIYNIGENGRAFTSEGFKQFNFVDANREVAPLVEYKTGGEVAYINYAQNRNEILFSNNFMVDFDITYDESNLNIEKKKYDLVKTEYKQSSYQDKRTRLVMKSKKVKVGWIKITVWYPAIETYYETVIVNTPHNTYQEVVQHVGSISLEDNANILTELTANAVDKYFPDVRKMSNEYNIPLLIMFMDSVVGKVVNVIKQLLSMIADFIPVLDEIKTAFETVKGYDMFTGESIGTFWRIFGAVTLVVSLVVSFVSFGAGGIAIDAAADAAQFAKKSAKFANNAKTVANATESLSDGYKSIRKLDGLQELGGNALKFAKKNSDDVVAALKKIDGDTAADLIEQGASVSRKVDNVLDLGKTGKKTLANGVEITQVSKSSDVFKKNPFDRGFELDDFGGNNLGRTYKTVDRLDETTDTVTSIKSLDTTAKTYQNPSKFKSTINKYLSEVDADQFGKAGRDVIIYKGDDFTKTAVDLYIPKDGFTKDQFDIISNLKLKDGIKLNIIMLS